MIYHIRVLTKSANIVYDRMQNGLPIDRFNFAQEEVDRKARISMHDSIQVYYWRAP